MAAVGALLVTAGCRDMFFPGAALPLPAAGFEPLVRRAGGRASRAWRAPPRRSADCRVAAASSSGTARLRTSIPVGRTCVGQAYAESCEVPSSIAVLLGAHRPGRGRVSSGDTPARRSRATFVRDSRRFGNGVRSLDQAPTADGASRRRTRARPTVEQRSKSHKCEAQWLLHQDFGSSSSEGRN